MTQPLRRPGPHPRPGAGGAAVTGCASVHPPTADVILAVRMLSRRRNDGVSAAARTAGGSCGQWAGFACAAMLRSQCIRHREGAPRTGRSLPLNGTTAAVARHRLLGIGWHVVKRGHETKIPSAQASLTPQRRRALIHGGSPAAAVRVMTTSDGHRAALLPPRRAPGARQGPAVRWRRSRWPAIGDPTRGPARRGWLAAPPQHGGCPATGRRPSSGCAVTGSVVPPTYAPTTRRAPRTAAKPWVVHPIAAPGPALLPSNHVVRHEPRLFFDC
jgi:hypothetical protein